jgi:hypothetical protein
MSTERRTNMADVQKGLFEGLIEALADKHSQLDLNFDRVRLNFPGVQQLGVELSGKITLAVHMREMSDDEKRALASKNVALTSTG